MRRAQLAAVISGFIFLAIVGCGSDDDGDPDAAPDTPSEATPGDLTAETTPTGPQTDLTWRISDEDASLNEGELADAGELLVNRLDTAGFADAQPTVTGDELTIVVADEVPERVASKISKPTKLTFNPVLAAGSTAGGGSSTGDDADGTVLKDERGESLTIGKAAITTGDIANASADLDQQASGWVINIAFTEAGQTGWTDLTAQAACQPQGDPRQRIAIVLNENEVISSPAVVGVQCEVGLTGNTIISGDFTQESATDLADQLSAARLLNGLEFDGLQINPN